MVFELPAQIEDGGGKQRVHLVVQGNDSLGGLGVPVDVGEDGALDHHAGLLAHGADVGQGAGLLLLLEQQGDLGDVGALVADAL